MPRPGGRNVHRQDPAVGRGDIAHFPPGDAVVAGFQEVLIGGRRIPPDAADLTAAESQGADQLRIFKGILNPGVFLAHGQGKFQILVEISVRELFHREMAAGGRYFRAHVLHGPLRIGQFHGQRSHMLEPVRRIAAVSDILIGAGRIEVRRHPDQLDRAAPGHFLRPPGELFHRVRRLHPRTARGAPARRRRHGRFHAFLRRQLHRVAHRYLPLRRLVRHRLVHDGRHPDAARVELMEPADAGLLHPVDIFRDSVDRHVPVHPMPPHARPGLLRRIRELLVQPLGACRLRDSQQGEEKPSIFHRCKVNLFFVKLPIFPTFVSRIQENDL